MGFEQAGLGLRGQELDALCHHSEDAEQLGQGGQAENNTSRWGTSVWGSLCAHQPGMGKLCSLCGCGNVGRKLLEPRKA